MKHILNSFLILILLFPISACNSKRSSKEPEPLNEIIIKNSWARPAGKGANSAAYLTIINRTRQADTLKSLSTNVAEMAGIHKTYHSENGMTGMKEAETIILNPDSSLTLAPGGYHIMLMNLKRELAKNDTLQIIFNFAVWGKKKVLVPVKGL